MAATFSAFEDSSHWLPWRLHMFTLLPIVDKRVPVSKPSSIFVSLPFSLGSCWKLKVLSLLIRTDSFAGSLRLDWQFWFLRIWKAYSEPFLFLHFLLRSWMLIWGACLYKCLSSLVAFNILSLFCRLTVLSVVWCGEILFLSLMFSVHVCPVSG